MNPIARYFMEISWAMKPIINFSWKIDGLKNRPWKWNICIQGPEKCFPGFLMTFSWDFHNIAVHSVCIVAHSFQLSLFIFHAGSAVSKKSSFSYRGHTSGLTKKMAARRQHFYSEEVIERVLVESVETEEDEVSLNDILETSISNFTALRRSISNYTNFREELFVS